MFFFSEINYNGIASPKFVLLATFNAAQYNVIQFCWTRTTRPSWLWWYGVMRMIMMITKRYTCGQ